MTFDRSAAWRKSSFSTATGNCVEVAPLGDAVAVRHSKRPAAGTILVAYPEWSGFVSAARSGSAHAGDAVAVAEVGTDTVVRAGGVELCFDAAEWAAFRAGAVAGEFDFGPF